MSADGSLQAPIIGDTAAQNPDDFPIPAPITDLENVKRTRKFLQRQKRHKWFYYDTKFGCGLGDSDDEAEARRAHAELRKPQVAAPKGTFNDLVRAFCNTDKWRGLALTTQENYLRQLEPLRQEFGHLPPEQISEVAMRGHLKKLEGKPSVQYVRLRDFRMVIRWGTGHKDFSLIGKHTTVDIMVDRPDSKSDVWTMSQRKTMYDGLPIEQMVRLYRSIAQREYQKDKMRRALRQLGLPAAQMMVTEYDEDEKPEERNMTTEELDALYLDVVHGLGLNSWPRIFDGMTLVERAATYRDDDFDEKDYAIATARRAYMKMAGLAAFYLGQRKGDMLNMMKSKKLTHPKGKKNNRYLYSYYDDDGRLWTVAHVLQNKTGVEVDVPFHPKLENQLREHKWRGTGLLFASPTGGFWDEHNFGEYWRHECEILGIKDVTEHDMRRSLRTSLTNASCSEAEICAVLGHKLATVANNPMADVYRSRNRTLAVNAIKKLEIYEIKQEENFKRRLAAGITEDEMDEVDFLIDVPQIEHRKPRTGKDALSESDRGLALATKFGV